MEARLISLAVAAGRSHVENGTNPPPPALPEADVSDMDYFVDQLKIVLPVLGVNVFRGRVLEEPAQPPLTSVVSPEFHLTVPSRGIAARAIQVDGEFTVLTGSIGASEMKTGSLPHPHRTRTGNSEPSRRSCWLTAQCGLTDQDPSSLVTSSSPRRPPLALLSRVVPATDARNGSRRRA